MQGNFWHLFLTQFFMLLHMAPLVLLSIAALLTLFWLVEIIQHKRPWKTSSFPMRLKQNCWWKCMNWWTFFSILTGIPQKKLQKVIFYFHWKNRQKGLYVLHCHLKGNASIKKLNMWTFSLMPTKSTNQIWVLWVSHLGGSASNQQGRTRQLKLRGLYSS